MKIPFSYLSKQFDDRTTDRILAQIKQMVRRADFTLGKEVGVFEKKIARLCGTRYAVGVMSGTDALFLSLKALGIGLGDEVITTVNTFFATAGAIVIAGATPVFVDVGTDYLMDVSKIERAITKRTKAIIPVHWTGNVCDMDAIRRIAKQRNLFIVEDACQAIDASYRGKKTGSFGDAGAFSMHPLKNLNVWGDGGMITTNSRALYAKLLLMRNHGLVDRNTSALYAYNARLSTLQAVVALDVLRTLPDITKRRIALARFYDKELGRIPHITLPPRSPEKKQVFHLYIVQAKKRDGLLAWLVKHGVDAKIHYPLPLHLQPASRQLGLPYKRGDFRVAEAQATSIISLPLHQHMTMREAKHIVDSVKAFYAQ